MSAGPRRVGVWLAAIAAAGAVAAVLAIRARNADAPAPRPGPAASGAGSDAPVRPERPDVRAAGAGSDSAPGLVEAGRAEAAARHHAQALALYQRAYELDARAATLLEIGRMQHVTGRCREARRTTQRVIASSPDPATAADARELLERIGRCD